MESNITSVTRSPRPYFKSSEKNLLQKDRSSDGFIKVTSTLVEVKAIQEARKLGAEEADQMKDYAKIINTPIPWVRVEKDGTRRELEFEMVLYVFNNQKVAQAWGDALVKNLGGIHDVQEDS